jgi:chromosome segregation ATPase
VQAEIYKGVDENGHVTYSSTPIKGGKRIILEPLSTMDPAKERWSGTSAENFPRVDGEMQKKRDDTRYLILQNELVAEEKALKEAKEKLQEGEENPEVFKGSGGKTYRNVAKYDGKIKVLTEQVDLHQKNVDALKTELSKLK